MSSISIDELEERLGVDFFDYQEHVLMAEWDASPFQQRVCLYYRTGAGKTLTALALIALKGYTRAVVIAPPSTHTSWVEAGRRLGIGVELMSHAKFRQKGTTLSRNTPVIADEFHLFGGHGGQGWTKLDRLSAGLNAPMILASATPNYNDAERVYCIQHILDPHSCKGGFLEFIYTHCETKQNPFGQMPLVEGFRNHKDAADYLQKLPHVYYVPDTVSYSIKDIGVVVDLPDDFMKYGLDRRRRRIMASQIEERHALVNHRLIQENGTIQPQVMLELHRLLRAGEPALIYATHATVAEALSRTFSADGYNHALVTGRNSTSAKATIIEDFKNGEFSWLIGTATLGTGTDGLDKVCDTLIILDDTDDDAARRQLIGRIMPRGADADASNKKVYRFLFA